MKLNNGITDEASNLGVIGVDCWSRAHGLEEYGNQRAHCTYLHHVKSNLCRFNAPVPIGVIGRMRCSHGCMSGRIARRHRRSLSQSAVLVVGILENLCI